MGGCLCDNSSMLWEILGHLKICAAHHMHCDLFLEAVVSKSQLWFVRLKKNRFNDKQAPSASSFTHQTWRDDIRAALKIRLYIMIILTKTAKKKILFVKVQMQTLSKWRSLLLLTVLLVFTQQRFKIAQIQIIPGRKTLFALSDDSVSAQEDCSREEKKKESWCGQQQIKMCVNFCLLKSRLLRVETLGN